MLGAMFSLFFTAFSSFVNKAYLKNNFPTDLSYVSSFFYRISQMFSGFYYVFNCYQCRIAFIIVI